MGNSGSAVEVSEVNLLMFYENYYEASENIIGAEGILRLCADMDLPADDFRILLFAWKCDAEQMGRLSKHEFLKVYVDILQLWALVIIYFFRVVGFWEQILHGTWNQVWRML